VVVIAVAENAVTVTYTDVHFARAKFFTDLFNECRRASWAEIAA
jgi:hypothetical protein